MRRAVVPAALGLVFVLWTNGWAGSPTDQLRGVFGAAARILEDPETEGKPEERMDAIRRLVRSAFDFGEAARLSLGADWSERTPAERARFVRLFADLLERSFIVGLTSRISVGDAIRVSYLGESIDGATAIVRTTVVARSGLELPFDYRMIERGSRWAVCDVAIDGVSLVANYRAQFARVIQTSSYPELVQQIERRVSGAVIETVHGESPAPLAAGAEMPPDLAGRELVARVGEPRPPAPVVLAPAEVGRAPIRTTRAAENRVARTSPGPIPASRERSLPAAPLTVVATVRPASAPAPNARAYWVQVGAFTSAGAAGRVATAIRRQEGPTSMRPVTVEAASGPVSLTRVRVGPFPDREAAMVKLRELQGRGYQPFIAEARD